MGVAVKIREIDESVRGIGDLAKSAGRDSSSINARRREIVDLGGISGNAGDIKAVADRFELSIRGAESTLLAHNELVKATIAVDVAHLDKISSINAADVDSLKAEIGKFKAR